MKKKHEIDTIIFDLTGVLFHINKMHIFKMIGPLDVIWYVLTHWKNPLYPCLEILKTKHDEEIKDYPIIYYKNYPQPRCVTQLMLGKKTRKETRDEIADYIATLEKRGHFTSDHEARIIKKILQAMFAQEGNVQATKPIKRMIAFLKQLKETTNHTLLLLSNLDKETYKGLANLHQHIFNVFDGIVISAHVQKVKPYKNMFHHILTMHNLKPEQCLFIDDQQENTTSAREHGIRSILFKNIKKLKKYLRNNDII